MTAGIALLLEKQSFMMYGNFPLGLSTGTWLAMTRLSNASLSVSNSMRPLELRSVFDGNILMHFGLGVLCDKNNSSISVASNPGGVLKKWRILEGG